MFYDSVEDLLENIFVAESDLNQPFDNPISTPSMSSISSMEDDLEINARDRIEQVNNANCPLKKLLAPNRVNTPSCIVI